MDILSATILHTTWVCQRKGTPNMTIEVISDVSTVAQNDADFEKQLNDTLQNIGSLKAQFVKARGRKALAGMIVTGFIQSLTIIHSVSDDVQALILSQHQISMANEANRFSPWIACCFGEDDPNAEKVADLLGEQCAKWMPDKSMARYFHTMEALSEAGFTETSPVKDMVDWIMKEGGCQTVANKRKDKVKLEENPELLEAQAEQRELYLSDGPSASSFWTRTPSSCPKTLDRSSPLWSRRPKKVISSFGALATRTQSTS